MSYARRLRDEADRLAKFIRQDGHDLSDGLRAGLAQSVKDLRDESDRQFTIERRSPDAQKTPA